MAKGNRKEGKVAVTKRVTNKFGTTYDKTVWMNPEKSTQVTRASLQAPTSAFQSDLDIFEGRYDDRRDSGRFEDIMDQADEYGMSEDLAAQYMELDLKGLTLDMQLEDFADLYDSDDDSIEMCLNFAETSAKSMLPGNLFTRDSVPVSRQKAREFINKFLTDSDYQQFVYSGEIGDPQKPGELLDYLWRMKKESPEATEHLLIHGELPKYIKYFEEREESLKVIAKSVTDGHYLEEWHELYTEYNRKISLNLAATQSMCDKFGTSTEEFGVIIDVLNDYHAATGSAGEEHDTGGLLIKLSNRDDGKEFVQYILHENIDPEDLTICVENEIPFENYHAAFEGALYGEQELEMVKLYRKLHNQDEDRSREISAVANLAKETRFRGNNGDEWNDSLPELKKDPAYTAITSDTWKILEFEEPTLE